MTKKGVDVGFMKMVNNEADWAREVAECKGVLCIIDAFYTTWGPCEMLAQHFCNFFFDLGDSKSIKFVRADATLNIKVPLKEANVNRLESEPLFLFMLDGELKKTINGADLPEISEAIMTLAPAIEKSH